jgi:hypothetical protein
VADNDVVDVLLLDLPAALWATQAEHTRRLLELDAPPGSAVDRLRTLVGRLREAYGDATAPAEAELEAAATRGSRTPVDVAYPIPRSARDDIVALIAALDAADEECCRTGPDALPADALEFRRWFFGELVRQIDGGFPTAWPGAKRR